MNQIHYSDKYYDNKYEYRHVILPKELIARIRPNKVLSEREWRDLGICMSRGWVHYGCHKPEPNILLFKRKFKPGEGQNPRAVLEEKSKEFQKLRSKKSLRKQRIGNTENRK